MLNTKNKLAVVVLALVVLGVAAVSSALVVNASGASPTSTPTTVGLRATLTSADVRAQRGLFVGSLRVQTLTWSLAYRGLSGSTLIAQIRLGRPGSGGPVAATLCDACRKQGRGRRVVTDRVAQALASNGAYVELRDRISQGRRIAGRVAVASMPTLEIVSPKAGETLELPAKISYRLSGLAVEQTLAFLAVYVAGFDGRRVEIPISSAEGEVVLPDAKDAFLVGHRDLTFQLATVNRVLVPNPEAIVVVRNLTIEGRRVG